MSTSSPLDRIPLSAAVLLHLGCGDGRLAAGFRARNPACRLIGIEPDPALAAQAATRLDLAYCLSPIPGPLPVLPPLDAILVGPTLAASPALLAILARRLAPGGVLVLCTPPGAPAPAALAEAGLHPLDATETTSPPGTAWRAAAAPVAPLRIVSSMLPHVGGVSQVRVVEPLRALAAEPGIATAIAPPDPAPDRGGQPGIYILHRPALRGAQGLATVRALIDRGWVVVCEFDDHPSQIPVLHRSDIHNFDGVHAIQTSTPALAEVLGRENPEVAVFPNALLTLPEPANFATPGCLTVLFAALNREEDWPDQIDALNRAARAAGPALRFEVIADQGFHDALDTPHKRFTPLCNYDTYLGILARCEVSLMPLRDTLFNRCKSDLKFLEAAAHRAVALASPTAYAGSIQPGRNGMIFHTPEELEAQLIHLARNPQAALVLATQARHDVAQSRMLGHQTRARLAWYRTLWHRRPALHEALLSRVPSLGG